MQDSSTFILKPKEFKLFRDLIYKEAGIALGEGKHQLVESRLSKRLRSLDLTTYQQYYEYLMKSDPGDEERLRMINCLTTNKTDFFREDHHFKYLKSHVFPALEKRARENGERKLRIWSAACSTGEEPYTIAMTVLEHFGPMSVNGWDIRILASDVDTDVLAHGQRGLYSAERVADVPKDILKKYFIRTSRSDEASFQIRPDLQELITFRRINFIEPEWPIHTVFDLIFCRNVMIYFDEPTQDRLLSRFSEVLVPEGHLFIGHSESILRLDHIYKSIGSTVYRVRPGIGGTTREQSMPVPLQTPVPFNHSNLPEHIRPALSRNEHPLRHHKNLNATTRTDRASRPVTTSNSPEDSLATSRVSNDVPIRPIIVGQVEASATPLRLTTLVGSCIAVCLFDPKYNIGGMNHFMLPCCTTVDRQCATYGIHAMELLVNEIMKLGGDRRRLVAKVFGGGNVLGRNESPGSIHAIGERNAQFAMEFLQTDGIPVVAQDIGGLTGRQVHFLTHTGQAFVRPVQGVDESFEQNVRHMKNRVSLPAAESSSGILF